MWGIYEEIQIWTAVVDESEEYDRRSKFQIWLIYLICITMWSNVDAMQNSPKLPRISARYYYNASLIG